MGLSGRQEFLRLPPAMLGDQARRTLRRNFGTAAVLAGCAIACGAEDVQPTPECPGLAHRAPDAIAADPHEAFRTPLIRHVWGGDTLPTGGSVTAEAIDQHPDYGPIAGLERLQRLRFGLSLGLESIGVLMVPVDANGGVIIYHNGHCTPCRASAADVVFLLERGFTVIELWMPVYGPNPPTEVIVGGQSISLDDHNDFRLLDTDTTSGLRFFLEPVARAVDYASAELGVAFVDMVGLSGGAWTITVYAAMDPRVRYSFPVAGTLPFELLGVDPNGHYELDPPTGFTDGPIQPFYDVADMEDLYVLGGAGPGRRQLQILNAFDTCCFTADPIRAGIRAYEARVQDRLSDLATGSFEVWIDETIRTHAISPTALDMIASGLCD